MVDGAGAMDGEGDSVTGGKSWDVIHGDCREVMAGMEAGSIDAIVCDPPYGLSFMGREWDHGVPGAPFWQEALRVAKPGAHILAFGGTRTFHRLACAIEDAGWEIRDCLTWLYGSGFPKSLDVSKAIDREAGARRTDDGPSLLASKQTAKRGTVTLGAFAGDPRDTSPATDAASQWQGWGTALKPAWEPIILARKPLCGTVAANVQRHGAGALNIDGCRIGLGDGETPEDFRRIDPPTSAPRTGACFAQDQYTKEQFKRATECGSPLGRWPANVLLDEDAAALLDEQAPDTGAFAPVRGTEPSKPAKNTYGEYARGGGAFYGGERGGASRFFYCGKATTSERDAGLGGLPGNHPRPQRSGGAQNAEAAGTDYDAAQTIGLNRVTRVRNNHPTVKPVDLMQWLCRLVTPPGGLILDPFTGSGSTGIAALREGFRFVGIEQDEHFCRIARHRIAEDAPLFNGAAATRATA